MLSVLLTLRHSMLETQGHRAVGVGHWTEIMVIDEYCKMGIDWLLTELTLKMQSITGTSRASRTTLLEYSVEAQFRTN